MILVRTIVKVEMRDPMAINRTLTIRAKDEGVKGIRLIPTSNTLVVEFDDKSQRHYVDCGPLLIDYLTVEEKMLVPKDSWNGKDSLDA